MTAIDTNLTQQPEQAPAYDDSVPVMITFATNWRARVFMFRVLGAVLVLSGFAMWLLPSALDAAEVGVFKLGASALFVFVGMVLLTMKRVTNRPDAYFDPVRRELRVLQKNENGRPETVMRRSYDTLGSARFSDRQVELFNIDGSLLMRLPVESKEVLHALKTQLTGAVAISA
ncbi:MULTISPECIES: hypothetical protein [unclassified Ruegeria]|uniref:hypothetical protein n=1 Tax=unclassified Ruegeria TaxID=2625375 RepID=UPI00148968B1|nr:hypothetical protein [Ruegeria sp. HKCCD8929]